MSLSSKHSQITMNRSKETWVKLKNMCQTLEDICVDIDEFVCKEPVLFVGNQMETVGENMKNFFYGFVDEFVLPQAVDPVQHAASLKPSKSIDLVEPSTNSVVEIKENTVDGNTDDPKEAPLVPTEICHKPSSTGLRHLEQITSEISQSQNLDNRSEEEGVIYDGSLHSDATVFEFSDWGIENIFDLEETKTLLNGPTDKLECGSVTSTTHQSSELESSIICHENQEENAKHIIADGLTLSSEKLYESSNSSFRNATLSPDTVDCNPTETVDYFSLSSDIRSSCGSFTTLSFDSTNEVDFEEIKNNTVESCVMVEGGKLSAFPTTSRSKSYKKMIQDAFMSRKRLAKEYKQLAIWYGDIDKELCQPTGESSKVPAQDQPDSEWELL